MDDFKSGGDFRKTGTPLHGDAPLTSLYGIGESTEERLVAAGYLSVADLVTAAPKEIAEVDGISLPMAFDIIDAARSELGYWPDDDE